MAKQDNDEVKAAKQAASDNLRRNSGRDQATCEHAVDVAEKSARRNRR